jgi:hypothetical protein
MKYQEMYDERIHGGCASVLLKYLQKRQIVHRSDDYDYELGDAYASA